jgi:hypothetical protein
MVRRRGAGARRGQLHEADQQYGQHSRWIDTSTAQHSTLEHHTMAQAVVWAMPKNTKTLIALSDQDKKKLSVERNACLCSYVSCQQQWGPSVLAFWPALLPGPLFGSIKLSR